MKNKEREILLANTKLHHFENNDRCSGRTSIIITISIVKLLTEGHVLLTDHFHERTCDVNFYKEYIVPRFYSALSAILEIDIESTLLCFYNKVKIIDGVCVGVEFKSHRFYNKYGK